MNHTLDGHVAIVTGAGRRLGRLHALALAANGAAIVINDVDSSAAERVVGEITAAGGRAVSCIASVADATDAQRIVDTAIDTFGSLHIVINNAGFMRNAYVDAITDPMFRDVLDVHVTGSFAVTRAAWPHMKANSYGRVVMTSSAMAFFPMPAGANYGAAKAAVFGLTKSLAREGEPLGIRVNAILPQANPLEDDNAVLSDDDAQRWSNENWGTPAVEAFLTDSYLNVMHRRDPALVTPMVAYLASPDCAVNGEAFAAGLGRYARVFVSEGPGWRHTGDGLPTAEDIAANLDAIMNTAGALIPRDLIDEHAFLARDTD